MKPCVGGGQSQSALWSASAGGVCSELWLLADVIALKGPKRAKVAEHAAQHAWHACDRLEDDEPVADRACWRVDSIVAGGKVEGVVRHAHGLLQHDVKEALRQQQGKTQKPNAFESASIVRKRHARVLRSA